MLGLCAGLDQPTSGSVELQQNHLESLNEDQLASVRNRHVGFVFQNFQLMPTLTAIEKVMVPLELRGEKKVRARAMEFLDKMGLAERSHHYPAQLSGKFVDLNPFKDQFTNVPVLHDEQRKKGLYMTYYQFLNDTPSNVDFEIEKINLPMGSLSLIPAAQSRNITKTK